MLLKELLGEAKKSIGVIVVMFALVFGWGSGTAAASLPETIRIGVVASTGQAAYKNAGAVKFAVQGKYQVIDLAAFPGLDVLGEVQEGSSWQVAYLTTGLQVLCDGQPILITPGPVVVREVSHTEGNLVKLVNYNPIGSTTETNINRRFRGNMEFRVGPGYLIGVNELPLEEYLYGVVPREMSSSWPLEALKAQALAARTYASANFNRRISLGFNLLDTPDDQAYGGYNSEGAAYTQAVQQTKGEIITYTGKPISAVYHSNSGGHTEDNENVWTGTPVAYLRGKADPYSRSSRFSNWNYVTVAQGVDSLGRIGVQDRLRQIDPQFGTLAGFQVEKFNSGRVRKIVISDTSGYTIERTGREFGQLFNPSFYTHLNEDSFMSNYFEVVTGNSFVVIDATGQVRTLKGEPGLMAVNGDGFITTLDSGATGIFAASALETSKLSVYPDAITFAGHGWGHGVGMSQWGANQMAKEGKSYREIINFYYTGVEITRN